MIVYITCHKRKSLRCHRNHCYQISLVPLRILPESSHVPPPGGYGTLEELLEVITWSQLGIHEKPVSAQLSFEVHFIMLNCQFILLEYCACRILAHLLMPVTCIELQVGLLNVDGYYNPLLALFDKALEEGFLGFSARNIVVSAPTASELLDKMEVSIYWKQTNLQIQILQSTC